ncbi:hypothetical protein Tco_0003915 [Tanacetum coccineum]
METTNKGNTDKDCIDNSNSAMSKGKYVPVCKKNNPNVYSHVPVIGCVLGLASVTTWDEIEKKMRARKTKTCADKAKGKRKFNEKRGTIFNSNKEIVMIAPRVRDVYVLDMTSSAQESFYIYNHKDHLRKFDEKADDGYLLGYSLVSKAFRVFNTRRQQTKETYHITFDEIPKAIKFLNPLVDNINIVELEIYPPDEYLYPYEPSQRYQTNSSDVSFIEPSECPEPVVLKTKVSSDQNDQIDQNDQPVQNDEILNDDHSKHSNHTNDEQIINSLLNTKDIHISKHLSSPNTEDTLA